MQNTTEDRITGILLGHALGSTIGAVNRMSETATAEHYPYPEPARWTPDTDHLLLAAECMSHGDIHELASRLAEWTEANKSAITGGGLLSAVITHPDFLDSPEKAAYDIWVKSGKNYAPAYPLSRACITGLLPGTEDVIRATRESTLLTHADPRCACASTIIALIVHGLVYNPPSASDHIDVLLSNAVNAARDIYRDASLDELSDWVRTGYTSSISQLSLGDISRAGYVYKCLACAVYAVRIIATSLKNSRPINIVRTLEHISGERGASDMNCAIAGAIIGAYAGGTKIKPQLQSDHEHVLRVGAQLAESLNHTSA